MTKPHKSMYEDWIHKQRIASHIFLNHIITIPNNLISDIKTWNYKGLDEEELRQIVTSIN